MNEMGQKLSIAAFRKRDVRIMTLEKGL